MTTLATTRLEERLERGDIVMFEPCPFALPSGDDLAFLLQQRLRGPSAKNISYDPAERTVFGHAQRSDERTQRLLRLMSEYSQQASGYLARLLPRYAALWQPDRASFRPEEEATRKLRLTARNDLLHFDAFPSRPTRGQRILRFYVNIHPTDDRVWATSETFDKVFEKYANQVGRPGEYTMSWTRRLSQHAVALFRPKVLERTEYDEFMLRLHHFLKSNDEFQERAPRRLWHFKPGTAWLLFADAVSHAELRGRFALEHSFFVAPASLVLPDEAPAALLERRGQHAALPMAA